MGSNASSQHRVLIVDDDRVSRKLAATALSKGGFKVFEVGDGQASIDLFKRQVIDIILMDFMMPGMNGLEACAALRQLPNAEHTPIVMMTGLHDTQSINQAYAAGAIDFITKPINFSVLPHRIEFIFRAQQSINLAKDNERRLAMVQKVSRIGHLEVHARTHHIHVSEGIRNIFGLTGNSPEYLSDFLDHIHPDDTDDTLRKIDDALTNNLKLSLEHRIILHNGDERIIYEESEPSSTDDRLFIAQDITERRQAERDIVQLAYYDKLTGLPNRSYIKKHLGYVLELSKRYNRIGGVLSVDLDLFQRINDNFGHTVGDQLITETAVRLSKCMRQSDCITRAVCADGTQDTNDRQGDTIAHLGGDEFVIILGEIDRPEDAAIVARRITQTLSQPFLIEGSEIHITVSIGIGLFPENGDETSLLLKNVASAMHHAKSIGRNNFQFHSEQRNQETLEKLEMENDLRRAIERHELALHYQPKVSTLTGKILGMEALLRWNHPTKGLISPFKFIPLAEECGLIISIGTWVIEEACRQTKAWQREGLPKLRVAVNLSAKQFNDEHITQNITDILQRTQLSYQYLELEITEGILMDNCDHSNAILLHLKRMGLHIALDDFGTGYSSLNYLKQFPIDTLKIDRSFVIDVTTDPDSAAIGIAIVLLSKSLHLTVVAEGVETEAQLNFFRQHQADQIQGYFFSKPMPADEFKQWVLNHTGYSSEFINLYSDI